MGQQIEPFGKYLLLERLAAGGMAEVYLAKSSGANGVSKFLAIKRILPQFTDRADYVEMFKDEAKIAINLNHSNVVSIYDFGIEKKQFFIVMEFVEGRNLRQVINELKKHGIQFTIEQIVFMIKEAAAGLDHAHRCIDGTTGKPLNIIHRDMSPQNIMVSYEGEIKVIDFGIAKAGNQLEETKPGELKVKYGYMSPEQAEGTSMDIRTDIFSLGIVLWELLAHDRLFTANSEAAIMRKVRECQIPPIRKINPSVPVELEKIVHKALAKDINLRYQNSAMFHRDLNRFLNMKYPDFSPQDFSQFIKSTFKSVFAETRKKLVQYSSLQAPIDVEKTNVTQTVTHTSSNSQVSGPLMHQPTIVQQHFQYIPPPGLPPDGFEGGDNNSVDFSKSAKIDLRKLRDDSGIRNKAAALTHNTVSKRMAIQRTGMSSEDILVWTMRVMIASAILVGTYLGYDYVQKTDVTALAKKHLPQEILTLIWPPPKPMAVAPPENTGEVHIASSSQHKVTINSNPTGARIYINEQDTMAMTPHQLELESNKSFVLKLKKDGFHAQETRILTDKNPTSLSFNLIAMAESGFISIQVINGGTNPVIEVDGVRLSQQPPIEKLAINSKVPVRITARNPFTNLSDEVTVMVQPKTKQSVQLIVGRKKR
ncbi:MAG: protein kinase domain-containing protein [Pseudobdellovibrionaceae bacterium]